MDYSSTGALVCCFNIPLHRSNTPLLYHSIEFCKIYIIVILSDPALAGERRILSQ